MTARTTTIPAGVKRPTDRKPKMADIERLRAEVVNGTNPIPVEFTRRDGTTVTLHVLPVADWRGSAVRAVQGGDASLDFEVWGRGALVPEDVEVWIAEDVSFRQFQAFIDSYTEISGQSPGE